MITFTQPQANLLTRHRKSLISGGILLVLALHIVPMLYPSEPFWPIMQWSMYKDSKAAGPTQTTVRKVFATTRSGKTEAITPGYTGLSIFVLERDYFRPMAKGDRSAPGQLIAKLNSQRTADSFIEVRLERTLYTVTDSGIARTTQPVIRYPLEAPDSN